MLWEFFLVALSPIIVWVLYWYYTVNHYEKYLKTIPGPPPMPILGNIPDIGSSVTLLEAIFGFSRKFKGNFKLYYGAKPHIFLVDPKDLEYVLSSTTLIVKSDSYRLFRQWMGTGLLTSRADKWRKHRKIITPAFHFQILEQFVDVFNSESDILVKKLDAIPNKNSIDIYPYVARCTLDIICETAMGTSVNAQDDIDSEYVKCVKILLGTLLQRVLSPILANEFLYPFTNTYRKEKAALKVVHGYTKSVINRRKAQLYHKISKNTDGGVDSFGRKKKRAFIDLLLEYSMKNPSFTEKDIQEEADTFIVAGHDTTATSISFVLYALASNPDVQKKLYAEVRRIFSDNSEHHATYKDLNEMKYLEMVIKETLRFYTTAPYFGRAIEQDVNMNGQILPKGATVYIFSYAIHHNPDVYKDPETFDPERFSLENSKGRSPYAFIPFSAGPRNCIGQKFAMLEMKCVISNVIRNFEVCSTIPEHKVLLISEVVLKSGTGVCIQLRRRKLESKSVKYVDALKVET